jgi:hypothetical protein
MATSQIDKCRDILRLCQINNGPGILRLSPINDYRRDLGLKGLSGMSGCRLLQGIPYLL